MKPRTKQLLSFIIQYKLENWGDSPSTREMKDFLGVSTTSVVHYHLSKLYESGDLIQGPPNKARMIGVPGLEISWVG